MICDLLDAMGEAHISNRAGSNIRSGIETALLRDATPAGSLKKPLAALELDERWSTYVLPHINPTVVVVTNLGRDSFHRNANVDVVFDVLDKSLDCGATLVLNGDDLISHELAANNDKRVYFGIARMPGDPDVPEGIICDRLFCPHCDSLLEWEFSHYNHIGRAHCPNCDFGSPALDYEMTDIDFAGKTCRIRENKEPGAPTYTYRVVAVGGQTMPDSEYKKVAHAAYALFRSSYLQSAFIVARDNGETDKLAAYVAEERELALLLYNLMVKNNLFGYEAANHYYFNKLMLAEKVLLCEHLLKRYTP
jgi:hypothetical protein